MTDLELGWVIGFLEGEGSFEFRKKHHDVGVHATQVQREPLERVRTYTGIGWIGGPHKTQSPTRSPFYRWDITGPSARDLMLQMRPLLSPRRQVQIDTAFRLYEARPRRGSSEASRKSWITRRQRQASDSSQLRIVS